jgi:hypothetical protein
MNSIRILVIFLAIISLAACGLPMPTPLATPERTNGIVRSPTATNIPKPTIPQTNTPTATYQPTRTPIIVANQSETPTSTQTRNPMGRIYLWKFPLYVYHEPGRDYPDDFHKIHPTSTDVPSPDLAIGFAFSRYSGQIAYVINNNNVLEVWVGDSELKQVERVYVDKDSWLVDQPSPGYDVVRILWGPGDQTLLLNSNAFPSHIVLVDLKTKEWRDWEGQCNYIDRVPDTQIWSIWCEQPEGIEYMSLEVDQPFQTGELPKNAIKVNDWSISPDGKRILYASMNNRLYLIDEHEKKIDFGLSYLPQNPDEIGSYSTLKWSSDGTQLLIYADDLGRGLCTKNMHPPFKSKIDQCWLLLDSTSGKWLWSKSDKKSNSDEPVCNLEEQISDAALSPDGEWVLTFSWWSGSQQCGMLNSIDSGEVKAILRDVFESVYWSP